jgi:hypothetical protein
MLIIWLKYTITIMSASSSSYSESCGITVSDGQFKSKVVSCNTSGSDSLSTVLEQLEKTHKLGAIFVRVPTELIHSVESMGYKFHHYENGEYVLYKWNVPDIPDKVPAWATSMLGISCLILSPDGKSVLMIFEYDKYKAVTGIVEPNHFLGQTCFKEVQEETGIKLDLDFGLHVCGGGIGPSGKPGVTDSFVCFVAKAQHTDVVLDQFEIPSGIYRWFPIEFLITEVVPSAKDALSKFTSSSEGMATRATIQYDGIGPNGVQVSYKFNPYMILALQNYMERRSIPYYMMGATDLFY